MRRGRRSPPLSVLLVTTLAACSRPRQIGVVPAPVAGPDADVFPLVARELSSVSGGARMRVRLQPLGDIASVEQGTVKRPEEAPVGLLDARRRALARLHISVADTDSYSACPGTLVPARSEREWAASRARCPKEKIAIITVSLPQRDPSYRPAGDGNQDPLERQVLVRVSVDDLDRSGSMESVHDFVLRGHDRRWTIVATVTRSIVH